MTVRRRPIVVLLAALATLMILAAACSSPAAPAPTAAPAAKAPEATKAAPAPTTAPAAAPAATAAKPAEPTKPAASASAAPPKPSGWPTKPITMIVPWDAGGSTDVGFRLLAPLMEKTLGTPIEVVNKVGAGSQVGVAELARAKPDGYTIGNVSAPAVQTIYLDPDRKATFGWKDFAPIGLHVFDPGIIVVGADSKYKTLKDVVDDAKANPEKVKASTTGVMGDDHLAILQVMQGTGTKFAIVHFTGGAPAKTALLGGHTDVAFNNVGDWLNEYKSGKIRPLAVMDKERSKFYPQIPTVKEAIGMDLNSSSSRGMAAPAGTPKEIVNYISYAMEQAMKDPGMIQKMEDSGFTQRYMGPDAFDKYWIDFEEQVKPLMPLARATQQ